MLMWLTESLQNRSPAYICIYLPKHDGLRSSVQRVQVCAAFATSLSKVLWLLCFPVGQEALQSWRTWAGSKKVNSWCYPSPSLWISLSTWCLGKEALKNWKQRCKAISSDQRQWFRSFLLPSGFGGIVDFGSTVTPFCRYFSAKMAHTCHMLCALCKISWH